MGFSKKQLKEIGVTKFYKIIAVSMIEDWFLLDLDGLVTFLKLKKKPKLKGKNAYEKIKSLFKMGNKIYQKGSSSHKFIENLNISSIKKTLSKLFKILEKEINYTKKKK